MSTPSRSTTTSAWMWWLVLGVAVGANAASAAALSVTPSVVEVRAKPGGRLHGAFRVVNDTEESVTVLVESEALSTAGYIQRPPGEWLELSPSTVTLSPHQETAVRYRVKVPRHVRGEFAAEVVFVQHLRGATLGGFQVRFGMALYVSVAGTEQLSLDIGSMELEKSQASIVRIPITNTGNVHCRPEGTVVVRDATGEVRARGGLSRGFPAPPGRMETFSVSLGGVTFQPGAYVLSADLSCQATANLGPYHWSVEQPGSLNAQGRWTTPRAVPAPTAGP